MTNFDVGRDALGRFANRTHTAPEVSLSPPVRVPLANGRFAGLTPGVWDPATAEAYQSGQCVALAVALADEHDMNVRVVYNDDGDISHAWACDSAGTQCGDSYGWDSWETVVYATGREDVLYDFEDFTPDAMRSAASQEDNLPEQDYDTAATFVPALPLP